MKRIDRRTFLKTVPAVAAVGNVRWQAPASAAPFGQDYPHLDSQTTGQWWVIRAPGAPGTEAAAKAATKVPQIIELNVPRDQVLAFALYAHEGGVLKLTAALSAAPGRTPFSPAGDSARWRLDGSRQRAGWISGLSRHESVAEGERHEHVKPLNGIQLVQIQPGQSRSGQAGSESCTCVGRPAR